MAVELYWGGIELWLFVLILALLYGLESDVGRQCWWLVVLSSVLFVVGLGMVLAALYA